MLDPESADDLLVGLDESQRRAVTSSARPLAILAPAGSGKTRVLTRRIAWRVATEDAEAPHVLALTFTRKAATEMRTRLAGLGLERDVAAGTFHSIAYAQLRSLWADKGRPPPALAARKASLLGQVLAEEGRSAGLTPAVLAGEIEWAKARLLGPNDYAEGAARARRRPAAPVERVAEVYAAYERLKNRSKAIDLDDLLKLCGDALLSEPTFAAAQHWRFRHLFVDEFQDVNPLQLRLLDAWRGDHHDLCVVGDPQQAIYGWNGADAGFLEDFRSLYPPAEVVSLEHNYRSTPQVLAAANEVLRSARLTPTRAEPTQADGPAPAVVRHPTDGDEATAVARALRDHRTPRTRWSDQAVLVRTHGQIALLSEALRAARIPHRVRGGAAILDDPDVRRALDMLRRDDRPLAASLPDLDALAAESPADRSGSGDGPRPVGEGVGSSPPSPLITLTELARDHHRVDPRATAAGFAAWAVATLQAEGGDRPGDAVTVATFHAAKGLEWPVVHLAGLEDGFVPIGHARTTAARAEEARLLYVAMTRALRHLSCTWAARRTFNGRTVDRRICPWLRDAAERAEQGSTTTSRMPLPADWRQRIDTQRAALAAARADPSPELAAARSWRDEAARMARVEPGTIIDDRLLEAVVVTMPADRDELAAVPGMGRLLATKIGDGLLAALHGAPRTANDSSP